MNKTAGHDETAKRMPSRDAGVTFIEILITIVLMGTVVLGILALTRTSILASKTSKEAATVESALLSAAERVERADRDDFVCDLSGPIHAAAQVKLGVPLADASNYVTIEYEYLAANAWTPGCVDQPNLVQRITITMEHPESGLSRSVEVIKGDV